MVSSFQDRFVGKSLIGIGIVAKYWAGDDAVYNYSLGFGSYAMEYREW